MKIMLRIAGGLIFAFSYIFLFAPAFSTKVNLGILGLFIGFYMATNLVLWDLREEMKKGEK